MPVRPLIVLVPLLLSAVACSVPAGVAVRDLAAIHTEEDWQPRSPAMLSVAPGAYFGNPAERLRQSGLYEIEDHRALELAILDQIGGVNASSPGHALEASSWLLIELLHDDHTEARVKAAAILSQLAAHWITREGARLPATPPGGALVSALVALDRAEDLAAFRAALRALDEAALDDPLVAVRVLAGVGRKAHALALQNDEDRRLVFDVALRAVILGLQAAGDDPDATVAEAAGQRADILRDHATRP